ncbi:hypothetical protein PX699_00225 [Sphingobium sp. H39-3-25]|uniref:terminase small subunit-like protein n=1 Tax=Sphingobium arseniciresistens TaxID=3030834 RepID=UPI0023B9E043|nr:hypothetical protein [Sphingobium arseniciresistens]
MEDDTTLNGSLTVAEIVSANPLKLAAIGKTAIQDLGSRLRQMAALKPGSSSIRTSVMIDEIIERLMGGETMTSITTDPRMPSSSTIWNWCKGDAALDRDVKEAQAIGQRALADMRMNIAMGGEFSTGDARRDELLIKAINANIAQRNRPEFGERQQVDVRQAVQYVLPNDADKY